MPAAASDSPDAKVPGLSEPGLLHKILDLTEDGVVVADENGKFVLFNPAGQRIMRRGAVELSPDRWSDYYHVVDPETREPVSEGDLPLVRAMRGEKVDAQELLLLEPGQEPRLISVTGRPLQDEQGRPRGGFVTFRDITESRRVEGLLRASEGRYRALTELVSDHAYEFLVNEDRSMTPVWMSQGFREIGGFPDGEDVSRERLRSFIHPADLEVFRGHRDRLEQGEVDDCEFRVIARGGSVRWVHNNVRPIRDAASGRLVRVLGAARDITDQKLLDPLTGLPNRVAFIDRISVAVARLARAPEGIVALLYVDLDRFQVFNQSLGYAGGDELLKICATRLAETVAPGDTAAHVHGDEFGVLLTDLEHPSEALQMAQRISTRLSEPALVGETRVAPSASVGIAFASGPDDVANEIVRSAQTAVSRAKKSGTGRYEVYDPEMQRAAVARLELEASLREAIDAERFPLVYQPMVRLGDRRVIGFEALVRWAHPELGLIPPERFVPLAEETGVIVEIGGHVLHEACRQLREWQDRYPLAEPLVMSVNISARQVAVGDLLDRLDAALTSARLPSRSLKLEITETTLVADPNAAVALFQAVRSRGVRLGLDDFGTGHSSLSYLHRFPIDTLKVDQSFVHRLGSENEAEGIIGTIVALAAHLDLDVVAEGVETEEQYRELLRLGCSHGQGFLFGIPLPADQAVAYIEGLEEPGDQPGEELG